MRAAARFVKLAETFDADVTVSNRSQVVSGRSIIKGLMMLAASMGVIIELHAQDRKPKKPYGIDDLNSC